MSTQPQTKPQYTLITQSPLPPSLYGLMAVFNEPEALLKAAQSAYDAGYRKLQAYTPFPVNGLSEAIGFTHDRMSMITLIGGLFGCSGGFYMQYFANVVSYPLNIGGRPYNSWPAFIPVTFELTILCAALSALFGMLILNKLPQLYHPVFNVPEFKRAAEDGFFLCIQCLDPQFKYQETHNFLKSLIPQEVYEVEL